MPLVLKKVFKADEENEDTYDELRLNTIELQVLDNEIKSAKRKYTMTLKKRSHIINNLLFDYDFELGFNDKVIFNDHTGEIRVYRNQKMPYANSGGEEK